MNSRKATILDNVPSFYPISETQGLGNIGGLSLSPGSDHLIKERKVSTAILFLTLAETNLYGKWSRKHFALSQPIKRG